MQLSASQFAERAGVSVPTVTKWIKKGRITAIPSGSGGYLIDASELDRIQSHVATVKGATRNRLGSETPLETPVKGLETLEELATLRERCTQLAERLADAQNDKAEAQRLLVEMSEQVKGLRLLMDGTKKEGSAGAQNSRAGWFGRLFG